MIDFVLSANDPHGNGPPLYDDKGHLLAVPQLRLLPPDITFPPPLPASAVEWYLPIAPPEGSFDVKPAAAPVAFVPTPQPEQQPEQPLSPVPALTALVERVARALERIVDIADISAGGAGVARWVPGGNVSDNTSDNAATIISQVDESIVETDAADGAIAIADAAIDPVPVAPADPFALPPIPAGEETKITAERWAIVWPIYVEHAKAFRAGTGDWPDRETDAKWCVGDTVPVTRGEVRIIRKAWQVKVGKRSRKKRR